MSEPSYHILQIEKLALNLSLLPNFECHGELVLSILTSIYSGTNGKEHALSDLSKTLVSSPLECLPFKIFLCEINETFNLILKSI